MKPADKGRYSTGERRNRSKNENSSTGKFSHERPKPEAKGGFRYEQKSYKPFGQSKGIKPNDSRGDNPRNENRPRRENAFSPGDRYERPKEARRPENESRRNEPAFRQTDKRIFSENKSTRYERDRRPEFRSGEKPHGGNDFRRNDRTDGRSRDRQNPEPLEGRFPRREAESRDRNFPRRTSDSKDHVFPRRESESRERRFPRREAENVEPRNRWNRDEKYSDHRKSYEGKPARDHKFARENGSDFPRRDDRENKNFDLRAGAPVRHRGERSDNFRGNRESTSRNYQNENRREEPSRPPFKEYKPRATRPSGETEQSESRKKKQISPREAAVWTYIRWLKLHTRIDVAAERELKRANWESRDRALFFEIINGVVRQHGRLEWLIKRMTTTRDKPDPTGVAAAAVGLYQFLFLDRVPEYAIVDSTVEVAKKIAGPLTAGWVNAVLRRASVDKDVLLEMLPELTKAGIQDRLSVEYSYPGWMISRWSEALSEDELRAFLIWGNRRPGLTLRVNQLKSPVEDVMAMLQDKGIVSSKIGGFPGYISLEHGTDPKWLDEILSGRASAQDVSQGLIARLVAPVNGEEILDLCSAPGGKTGHLAELAPDALITATDKAEERLDLVRDLVGRNGYRNVDVVRYDEIMSSRRKFDAILVDAPCSGTGVLARRADLRWRRSPDDIRRMAAVQLSLMRYAADRLKATGRIIYSTCSVEEEENERVVGRFLEDRKDFEIVPVKNYFNEDEHFQKDMLKLWGYEIEGDGVFGVVLRKKSR